MSGSLQLFAAICLCLVPYCARAAGEPITVFAAAITDVLPEIDHGYTREAGTPARVSFSASSTLARQIKAGAPAQILISADTQWMDCLARQELIAGQVPQFSNELAVR